MTELATTLKPIETRFAGRRFRSRTEARWAVFFAAIGWDFEYEKEGYDLDGEWYLPDFYLPRFPMWIEVKGVSPNQREVDLARKLAEASGHRVLIAVGAPRGGGEFLLIEPERLQDICPIPLSAVCSILADRRNEGEFWIAGGNDGIDFAFSIGPVRGPDCDRWPSAGPGTWTANELIRAHRTAMSARFEHGERAA